MSDRFRKRGVLGGALLIVAFAAGVGFATAVRLHPGPDTLSAAGQTPVPRLQDVRPVAELSQAFIAMSEAVTPAVVRIQTERPISLASRRGVGPHELFGSPPDDSVHQSIPEISGGTGIVVDGDGYILTNNHVVAAAERITVTLFDKRVFEAELVGTDPTTDVAVIRIPAKGLTAARLGDSEHTRVGEWVLTVGNPGFGAASTLDFTVTSGIISAKGRPLDILNQELLEDRDPAASYAIEDFIQTDAVINPGNSGGPLVNLRGEVIGVNTAIASETGFYEGYGFAIPINLARRVMRDLIRYGAVHRPVLGVRIRDITPEDAEVYHLPTIAGVLVQDFTGDDSPARSAGLQRHDVIVAVDDQRVDRVGQLQRLVAQHHPGEKTELGVVRFGDARHFTVELAQAPFSQRPTGEREPEHPQPTLGIRIGELTPQLARRLGYRRPGGALITGVQPGSAADRNSLVPGYRIVSIDREQVRSANDAQTRLKGLRSGKVVSLLLQRPEGDMLIVNVRVP